MKTEEQTKESRPSADNTGAAPKERTTYADDSTDSTQFNSTDSLFLVNHNKSSSAKISAAEQAAAFTPTWYKGVEELFAGIQSLPRTREKDGTYSCWFEFEGNRSVSNARGSCNVLFLDIDSAPLEMIKAPLKGLIHMTYTSFSHLDPNRPYRRDESGKVYSKGKEVTNPHPGVHCYGMDEVIADPSHWCQANPALRVIVPLASPVSAEDYPSFWRALQRMFGGILDTATRDVSRLMYDPRVGTEFTQQLEGELLDPKAVMAAYPEPVKRKAGRISSWGMAKPKASHTRLTNRLEDALQYITCTNHAEWVDIGMALHDDSEDNLDLWDRWSKGQPNYDEGECEKRWASFTAGKPGGKTVATIYHLAREAGWTDIRPDDFTQWDTAKQLEMASARPEAFGQLPYQERVSILRDAGMTKRDAEAQASTAGKAAQQAKEDEQEARNARIRTPDSIIIDERADNLVAEAFLDSLTVGGHRPTTQPKIGIEVIDADTNLWSFIGADQVHVMLTEFGGRCLYPTAKGDLRKVQMTASFAKGALELVTKSNPTPVEPVRAYVEDDGTITGVRDGKYFRRQARPEEHVRAEWAKGKYDLKDYQTLDDVRAGCPDSIKTFIHQFNKAESRMDPIPDLTLTQLLEAAATAIFQLQWHVGKEIDDGCVYFITDENGSNAGGGRGKSVWASMISSLSAVVGTTPLTKFDDAQACYGMYQDGQGRLVTLNLESDGDTSGALFDQGNLKKVPGCEEILVKALYRDVLRVTPMCAHIFVTNKLPAVLGAEGTTFNRINVIVMGGDDMRDPAAEQFRVRGLTQELNKPEALNWFWNAAHWGMMNILKNGKVTRDHNAIERYKGRVDNVAQFITDMLIPLPADYPAYKAPRLQEVYDAYRQDSIDAGHRNPANRDQFRDALQQRGLLQEYGRRELKVMVQIVQQCTTPSGPVVRMNGFSPLPSRREKDLVEEKEQLAARIAELEAKLAQQSAPSLEEPTNPEPPPVRKPNHGTNAKGVTTATFKVGDRPNVRTDLNPVPKSYIPPCFGPTEATREEMKSQSAAKETPRRRSSEPESL